MAVGADGKHRRLHTSFSLSKHWKTYDVFYRQKIKTFRSSRPAVLELAARYKDLVTQIKHDGNSTSAEHEEAEKILFFEMCEICLWGNATDLSLLTSLTYEDIQKLQGSEARKASEKNILVNDLGATYDVLKKAKSEGKKERRVDIVLDNAGFELYVDLILAGFLLSSGLATLVVLHPKSIPWFVSDVLPADFAALLNALVNPKQFYETPSDDDKLQDRTPSALSDKDVADLGFLFQEWSQMYAEGQLILRPNRFWTYPGSYWRLPSFEKSLYEDLKSSEVVIFKGDLNYRKLTGDVSIATPLIISHLSVLIYNRLHGTRQPRSLKLLDPSVPARGLMYLLSERAKLMSSSGLSRGRTKNSGLRRAAVEIAVPGNGRGVVSGLLCPSRKGNKYPMVMSRV